MQKRFIRNFIVIGICYYLYQIYNAFNNGEMSTKKAISYVLILLGLCLVIVCNLILYFRRKEKNRHK